MGCLKVQSLSYLIGHHCFYFLVFQVMHFIYGNVVTLLSDNIAKVYSQMQTLNYRKAMK